MARSASFFVRAAVLALGAVIAVDATALPVIEREVSVAKMKRDVWAPPVTEPKEGTVWTVGKTVQVTWCVRVSAYLQPRVRVFLMVQPFSFLLIAGLQLIRPLRSRIPTVCLSSVRRTASYRVMADWRNLLRVTFRFLMGRPRCKYQMSLPAMIIK